MSDENKMKALFEKYDTNKNGVLDRAEFFVIFNKFYQIWERIFPRKKTMK